MFGSRRRRSAHVRCVDTGRYQLGALSSNPRAPTSGWDGAVVLPHDGVSLNAVVGCSPLVEDGGVGVGGAEGEDGAVGHGCGCGGQLGGSLVVG